MAGRDQPNVTVVSDLRQAAGEFSFKVSGMLGEHRVRFWGDIPEHPLGPPPEPALAAVLGPAMSVGGELSLPRQLSPQLRRALPDLQGVLGWIAAECPGVSVSLQPVSILAPQGQIGAPRSESADVGVFFSGGVDSWLTVLANPDITDLIYVHGFDISLDAPEVSATVERHLADAAERCGKRLRIVRTDVRDLLDPSSPGRSHTVPRLRRSPCFSPPPADASLSGLPPPTPTWRCAGHTRCTITSGAPSSAASNTTGPT